MKVASFTVRGTMPQSVRWKQAAEGEGFRSVGAWLAEAADAYLKARARAGRPLPLAWCKGRFRVCLENGSKPELRGWIARPFGIFRGSPEGPIRHGSTHIYSLAYIPTGWLIATFRTAGNCKALASELAPVLFREEQAKASALIERHEREQA